MLHIEASKRLPLPRDDIWCVQTVLEVFTLRMDDKVCGARVPSRRRSNLSHSGSKIDQRGNPFSQLDSTYLQNRLIRSASTYSLPCLK